MQTKKIITYIVSYGVDFSHKTELKICDKKKEALSFVQKLPSGYKSYEILRREEIYKRISHGKYEMYPIETNDKIIAENNSKRWVYGTRYGTWKLVGNADRDYNSGITQEEMKKIGKAKAKAKYLGGNFI